MKESRLIIGLMTGTSVDAIDAALVEVTGAGPHLRAKLKCFHSIPFSNEVRAQILRVASGKAAGAAEISQLNFLLGMLFSEAVFQLCRQAKVELYQVDLIGSHGQTIYHQAEPSLFCRRQVASTLQIGEPSILAENTGITVVADFRPRDMAAGGKGAPLIPYVDYLLFRHARKGRLLLNLGGIANLTAIPASAKPQQVRAFDTGPGNMVVDALVQHFTLGSRKFDAAGQDARSGKVVLPLLEQLLKHPFFQLRPPKAAGREQFGQSFTSQILALQREHSYEDLVATATELTAVTVARAVKEHVQPRIHLDQMIISGGGAHNNYLLERIAALVPQVEVMTSTQMDIPIDAKEAMGFALLANETFQLNPANIPTATGARHPVVLGKVVYGNNYGRLRGKGRN
jgi:anhydro-N-acetylmuramic acid kinase